MKKIIWSFFLLTLFTLCFCFTANAAEVITIDAKSYSVGTPSKTNTASISMVKGTSFGYSVNFQYSPSEISFVASTIADHAGSMEVRLDSSGGKLIGSVTTAATDTWQKGTYSIPVSINMTGNHTIWFVYRGVGCDFHSLTCVIPDPTEMYETFSEENAFTDIADSPIRTEINLLADLGIIDSAQTEFDGERLITKREFLKAVGKLWQKIPTSSSEGQLFADVANTDADYSLVSWLCSTGVLKPDPEKNLGLNNAITLTDACDMLVSTLEYSDEANWRGGSYEVARRIGLLKGVNITSNTGKLKRKDMASLLWNTLESEYNVLTGLTQDGYLQYEAEDNILSYTSNIYMAEGVITATQNNNLYSNTVLASPACVIIGGKSYRCGETVATRYLGLNCVYFYTEQAGIRTLVAARPAFNTEYVYLSSKDTELGEISEDVVSYYEGDDIEELKMESNVITMYNGKKIDASLTSLVGKGSFDGSVLAIDNDGNGKYDILIVEQAYTIVFGGITKTSVYDLLRQESIECGDTSQIRLLYGVSGGAWDNLALGTIVDVYESKNKTGDKLIRMYPITSTAIGITNELDGEGTVTMEDGTRYKAYDYLKKPMILGKAVTLKLNSFDKYIDYTIGTSAQLALVIDKGIKGSGLDKTAAIRMLTSDNVIRNYNFADTVYADGVIINTSDEIYSGKGKFIGLDDMENDILILYALNGDGEVSMIDTELAGAGGEYDVLKETVPEGKYQIRGSYLSNTSAGDIRDQNAVLRNGFKIISVSTTGNENEHAFASSPGGDENANYNLVGYSTTTADSFITDVITIKRGYTSTKKGHFILTRRYYRSNSSGEKEIVLEGINSSGQVTYVIDSYAYYKSDNAESLQLTANSVLPGDLIQVSTNAKDYVTNISVCYFRDGKQTNSAGVTASHFDGNGYAAYDYNSGKLYVGEVVDYQDGFVKIKSVSSDGNEVYNYLNATGVRLVACDVNNGKCEIATTGSGWLSVGQKVAVFFGIYDTSPKMAVVYK